MKWPSLRNLCKKIIDISRSLPLVTIASRRCCWHLIHITNSSHNTPLSVVINKNECVCDKVLMLHLDIFCAFLSRSACRVFVTRKSDIDVKSNYVSTMCNNYFFSCSGVCFVSHEFAALNLTCVCVNLELNGAVSF
jgi:hypothetical protein